MQDGGTLEMWVAGDSLMIGARNALGLALLAGNDSAQRARAADLDERARRFIAALDTDTLALTFMHASIPADARRDYLARVHTMLGDSLSTRATVVGTAVDSPAGARSYVQIRRGRHARGPMDGPRVEWRVPHGFGPGLRRLAARP